MARHCASALTTHTNTLPLAPATRAPLAGDTWHPRSSAGCARRERTPPEAPSSAPLGSLPRGARPRSPPRGSHRSTGDGDSQRTPARSGRNRARRRSAEPVPAAGGPRRLSPPGGEGRAETARGGNRPGEAEGGERPTHRGRRSRARGWRAGRRLRRDRERSGSGQGDALRPPRGPEPRPTVPTEEKGDEPHGGSRQQRRGERRGVPCGPGRAAPPHRGPSPAPPPSCTAGGSRRARFKPLPGRMGRRERTPGWAGRSRRWARSGRCRGSAPAGTGVPRPAGRRLGPLRTAPQRRLEHSR